jgi:hypothetical protein
MRPANKAAGELLMFVTLWEDRAMAGRIRPVEVSATLMLFFCRENQATIERTQQ